MREPDFEGPGGAAWRIAIPPEERAAKPDYQASLGMWHLHCPGAHPLWTWYVVTLIHLRDIPGVAPAKKHYPEAAYEFIVMALNPDGGVPVQPGQLPRQLCYLTPFDHVLQFHGTTDEQAVRVVELYLRACTNGRLSPDQDYRAVWRDLMSGTIRHVVEGHHDA